MLGDYIKKSIYSNSTFLRKVLLGVVVGSCIVAAPLYALAYSRTLSVGSTGADVSALQVFLRSVGFFPSTTPPTGYYGAITQAAVAKYQASLGLPTVGVVGPLTLAALNNTGTPNPTASSIERSLSIGVSGPDVSALQQFLQTQGFYTYPTITGYFGPITQAAVKAFQLAHGIDPIGIVGPQTHAAITAVEGTSSTGSTDSSSETPSSSTNEPSHSHNSNSNNTLDTTAPTVDAVASSTTATTADITWTTDEAADSQVEYGTTSSYGQSTTLDATQVTSHAVSITGLSPSTAYHFRVRSADAGGNTTYSNDATFVTSSGAPDTTAPLISSVASSTSDTIATITWTTDENASSRVDFGTTSSYGTASTSAVLTTSHSITLSGLTVSTLYHFRVQSTDASSNTATSIDYTFTTSATPDTTAPVRSGGSPSGTLAYGTTSTTLALTTDENATCKYSTSSGTAYGSMTSFTTTGTTSHSSSISGLSNGTSYTYYVKCQDSSSNTNASDYTISFSVAADTTAPTVSMTVPSNGATVSGSSVTLTASASDDVAVAGVQFKLDTSTNIGAEDTGSPYTVSWNSTAVSDGSHTLSAVARDGNGNYATSSAVTVTVDNTGPIISSIASSTAVTTATITWTTNEASDSRVDYGATSSYGTASTSASLVTSRSIVLSGLTASTLYHFRVQSADAQGNVATSSDQTFTTASAADTTPPVISAIASSTTGTTATITWTTDEVASSTVQYGSTSSYGTASTSATLVTSHSITLTGLTAETLYHFQVGSADAAANVATSSDQTFTTGLSLGLALSGSPQQGIPDNFGVSFVTATSTYLSLAAAGVEESATGRIQATSTFPYALLTPQSSGTYTVRAYNASSGGTQVGESASFTVAASTVNTGTLSSSASIEVFGDSTIASNIDTAAPTHAAVYLTDRWFAYGQSLISSGGYDMWPNYHAGTGNEGTAGSSVGGSLDGVVGDTTLGYGSNGNSTAFPGYLSRLARVLMQRPAVTFVQVTVNDIGTGSSAGITTAAQSIANYTTIGDALTRAGSRVVFIMMRPFPSGTLDGAANHQRRIDINNGVASYCAGISGCLILDFGSIYGTGGSYSADPSPFNTNYISGFHPTNLGAMLEANYYQTWATSNNLFASGFNHARDDVYSGSGTSVVVYPTFSGTNAGTTLTLGCTGTFANGIRSCAGTNVASTTVTGSIISNSDTGGSAQRITLGPVGTGLQTFKINLERITTPILGYVGYLQGMVEIKITTDTEGLINGINGVFSATDNASLVNSNRQDLILDTNSAASGFWPVQATSTTYWLEWSAWLDGLQTKIDPSITFQVRPSGKSANAVIDIMRQQERKVTTDVRQTHFVPKAPTSVASLGSNSFRVTLDKTGPVPTAVRYWYRPATGNSSWIYAGEVVVTPGATTVDYSISGLTASTSYYTKAAQIENTGLLLGGYGRFSNEGTPSTPLQFTAS